MYLFQQKKIKYEFAKWKSKNVNVHRKVQHNYKQSINTVGITNYYELI
jgi:hypothetical protein